MVKAAIMLMKYGRFDQIGKRYGSAMLNAKHVTTYWKLEKPYFSLSFK